ncbi:hypothetical protein RHSIM_Rhsim03G0007700 [Rhododendron simsii]|uniref:Uncharacterized protein n=1 Tax=Rhododendron simsii TaxID=118357 RepID=A0A834HF53_RHOSS|nr:hypothetical protein RHSIM_Rhsim03G0007700 [Rhododendron simsii]
MGGNIPSPRRLEAFQEMLSSCGLVDLEFKGPRFTWQNNKVGGELIMERIDMAFANAKWREVHEQAMVLVEAAIGNCKPVIMEAWAQQYAGTQMERICKKLRGCKEKLKLWHHQHFGDQRLQIAILKDQLADFQKKLDLGFDSEAIA